MVSFDYELVWGTFERVPEQYIHSNVVHANAAAMRIAQVNEELGIPATWAVVGAAAFQVPWEERLELCRRAGAPVDLLAAIVARVSDESRAQIADIPQEFLDLIDSSTCQELGSHSFSHVYPDTASAGGLRADFRAFAEFRRQRGISYAMTYVAPKNMLTGTVRDLVREFGFANARVNPANWLYTQRSRSPIVAGVTRALRFLDAFLPINEVFSMFSRRVDVTGMVEGNFFFRPVIGSARVLDVLHRFRLRMWIRFALLTDRDIHLWTHPHNFGTDVERGLSNYRRAMELLLAVSAREDIPFIRTSEAA